MTATDTPDYRSAKLTAEQVRYIRRHHRAHDRLHGCCALAKKFGVHRATVAAVLNGETWPHVKAS